MHRCRTDTYQNERHAAWERIFKKYVCKKTNADGSPKSAQTVYFELFGMFERVFGVEGGGGRLGRTHVRTHGRTPARRPTPLHNYHFFKAKKHQYALCFSVFGSWYVEKSLKKPYVFHDVCVS